MTLLYAILGAQDAIIAVIKNEKIVNNVNVLSFTIFLILGSLYFWYPLLPLHLRELGAEEFQIGFSYTLFVLTFTLWQIGGGLLSDRYGRKLIIVIPTFLFLPLYVIAGLVQHWFYLTMILVVLESLSAIQWPSFISMISESVPQGKEGRAFAILELAIVLAATVGPFAGSLLVKKFSIELLIIISGIVAFPCAFIRKKYLTESFQPTERIRLRELLDAFDKNLIVFLIACCLLHLLNTLTIYGPFLSLFARDEMNLNNSQINILFGFAGLAASIISPIGGRLTDRFGAKRVLMLGSIFQGLFIFFWSRAEDYVPILIFFMLFGVSIQLAAISYNVFISSITPKELKSTVIGVFGTIAGLVGALGPVVGAIISKSFGISAIFVASLMFALGGFLFLSGVQEKK